MTRDDDKSPFAEAPTQVHRSVLPSHDPVVGYRIREKCGDGRGRLLTISSAEPTSVLIGSSPACALRLEDPHVSRRHVSLEVVGTRLRIQDLGSTNGTRVQGLLVLEALLHGGERIQLGGVVLEVERLDEAATVPASTADRFGQVIGSSVAMRRLYPLCERLAVSNVPVIIEGETGTGKEVLAQSLHEIGPRRSGPFVVFDCTAVPPSLVEAALFGHERGAFTGAVEARPGVFEEADHGTLLIDEIGDLDIELQGKLLRVIERSEVARVGATRRRKVDVRILAATRRDLDQEIQSDRFRDDLFYRLAVARIELPPLRRRATDVSVLARHFWAELVEDDLPIPPEFLQKLEGYRWPGNVRELRNAVARRVALGELDRMGARGSSRRSSTMPPPSAPVDALERVLAMGLPLPLARQRLIDAFERRYVERMLDEHGGNVRRAAEASGVARRYFQLLRARIRQRDE